MNDQAKKRIREQFSDVTEDELNRYDTDPNSVIASLSRRSGKSESDVRQALTDAAH